MSASAQLKLTSDGFVNADDNTKNYIAIDFPEKTQSQLYKSALMYLNTLYVSPKEVLSTMENEVITINGVGEFRAKCATGIPIDFRVNYTISLKFKDGKMRIDIPSINSISAPGVKMYLSGAGSMMGDTLVIFKKNGEVKREDAKIALELYFNQYFSNIIEKINGSDTDNDW